MKISPLCVVALTWTLSDAQGEVIDELNDATEFLVGGGDLLACIDEALLNQQPGARLDLHLEPEQAFGDYDEQLVFLEDRNRFPSELHEGMIFEGLPPGCSPAAPKAQLYYVTDVYPEHVVLDGNHPLAGIALRLSLRVVSVRAASPQETERGSVGQGFFSLAAQAPGGTSLH